MSVNSLEITFSAKSFQKVSIDLHKIKRKRPFIYRACMEEGRE